jgi:hypothetical protein
MSETVVFIGKMRLFVGTLKQSCPFMDVGCPRGLKTDTTGDLKNFRGVGDPSDHLNESPVIPCDSL